MIASPSATLPGPDHVECMIFWEAFEDRCPFEVKAKRAPGSCWVVTFHSYIGDGWDVSTHAFQVDGSDAAMWAVMVELAVFKGTHRCYYGQKNGTVTQRVTWKWQYYGTPGSPGRRERRQR